MAAVATKEVPVEEEVLDNVRVATLLAVDMQSLVERRTAATILLLLPPLSLRASLSAAAVTAFASEAEAGRKRTNKTRGRQPEFSNTQSDIVA